MTYYMFNEPALNGFNDALKNKYDDSNVYKLINKIKIPIKSLSEILDLYMPLNIDIDFLSIDVEGLDFQVLLSNNWNKYRPKIILVESLNSNNLKSVLNSDMSIFLENKNYVLYAKTINTLIYKSL